MKAVRVEFDSDCGIGNDVIHITGAGMVRKSITNSRFIIVRAVDENNHIVGEPIKIDMDIDVDSVLETEYPYEDYDQSR
jgi:hypothetical protein